MGWDTIQPGTASAVVGQPSEAEPSSRQTALPGRKIETAPPSGFRQRIVQAFVQFGRKLSSLASADSPDCSRLPNPESLERRTCKQLVSLLKLVGSLDFDDTRLGTELGKLEDVKQQWLKSSPEHTEEQLAAMVRRVLDRHWPGKEIRHLEKTVGALAEPDAAHLPHGLLRQQLAALVGARVGDYRTAEALKARHKDEIRKLDFDEARKVAGSIFWKGPALSAAIKAFDRARKDSEYRPGATEADLQAARTSLEEAGDRLLEVLGTTLPWRKAAPALRRRFFSDRNWNALAVKARNQTQADLYARFAGDYLQPPRNGDQVTVKVAQAKALQTQVACDGPRERGAPRDAEEQYFRLLRKRHDFLENVRKIGTPEEDDDMKALHDALDRLPTLTSGETRNATVEAPDYVAGLQTLEQALGAADRRVAALVAETTTKIAQLEQEPDTPARAAKAQTLVMETNRAVLTKLPTKEQLRLMKLMSGELRKQPPQGKKWQSFVDAQSKLYLAMELRPELLEHEKQLRRDVMRALEKDKKMLQEARDLWHTYTQEERRAVMMHIAKVHSEVLGCDPPRDIEFSSDSKMNNDYEWWRLSRRIVVRTTTDHYLDFEDMVDSVFHENTHNWQNQLVKGLKLQGAEQKPLHEQALIFAVNEPFYLGWRDGSVSGYMAYRGQPMEAHAFRSGRLLGGDLMRMLAS